MNDKKNGPTGSVINALKKVWGVLQAIEKFVYICLTNPNFWLGAAIGFAIGTLMVTTTYLLLYY